MSVTFEEKMCWSAQLQEIADQVALEMKWEFDPLLWVFTKSQGDGTCREIELTVPRLQPKCSREMTPQEIAHKFLEMAPQAILALLKYCEEIVPQATRILLQYP